MMPNNKARRAPLGLSLAAGAVLLFLHIPFAVVMLYAFTTDEATLTDSVARGKHVWEKNSCINCHTLLGEGAYFAPELGNVWTRLGGDDDVEGTRETFKSWMQAQPTGIEGRRQMPQFNLTDQELNDLADFLRWTNTIKTQKWPPNDAG